MRRTAAKKHTTSGKQSGLWRDMPHPPAPLPVFDTPLYVLCSPFAKTSSPNACPLKLPGHLSLLPKTV